MLGVFTRLLGQSGECVGGFAVRRKLLGLVSGRYYRNEYNASRLSHLFIYTKIATLAQFPQNASSIIDNFNHTFLEGTPR